MPATDYIALQQRYPRQYVAELDGEVIAAEPTYDQLVERLERMSVAWEKLTIQFVESPDVIGIY